MEPCDSEDPLQVQFEKTRTEIDGGSISPSPVPLTRRVTLDRTPVALTRTMVPLSQSGSVAAPRAALIVKEPPALRRAATLDRDLEDRFGKAKFVVLTTKSESGDHFHWFRKPSLRQEWLDVDHTILRRDRKDRKANLMALYYDLIFVAVIIILGHSVRLRSTLSANFFVDFIALFSIWLETLFFLDRFDSGDGLSRLLILMVMGGVVGMGITGYEAQRTIVVSVTGVSTGYVVAFLFARTSLELLYSTTLLIKAARNFAIVHHMIFLVTAAFWIGSIWAPSEAARLGLQGAGFGVGLLAPILLSLVPPKYLLSLPLNLEHIVERMALFSIIIIGETIAALFFVESGMYTRNEWVSAGLGLLLSFSLQWISFDIENGSHGPKLKRHALRRGGFASAVWILSHIPYHLSVICLGGGIWNVHNYYAGEAGAGAAAAHRAVIEAETNTTELKCLNATAYGYDPARDPCAEDAFFYARWLLAAGAAGALFFMTINGAAHSRDTSKNFLNVPARVAIRMACVLIIALVPLAGLAVSPLGYLGICCGLYGLNVIVGLEHRKGVKKVARTVSRGVSRKLKRQHKKEERKNARMTRHSEDLMRSLQLPEGIDLSRVIDVEIEEEEEEIVPAPGGYEEDHENNAYHHEMESR